MLDTRKCKHKRNVHSWRWGFFVVAISSHIQDTLYMHDLFTYTIASDYTKVNGANFIHKM